MLANFDQRLAQLQAMIEPETAWFLTTPTDIEYFTSFESLVPEEREAFLVVTKTQAFLLHASFSPTPNFKSLEKLSGTQVSLIVPHLTTIRSNSPFQKLIIDKTRLYADEFEALQSLVGVELTSLNREAIWKLRMVKDATEIAAIRRAGQIASQAFEKLQLQISAGMTEKVVQRLLDTLMVEFGSEKPAFPTIVAFGPHGALPHHQPTDTVLTANTPILLDFGATYHHYRSDLTRSWWFGDQPTAEFIKIKNLVDKAYERGIDALRQRHQLTEPLTAKKVDEACRRFLDEAGYGTNYIHTTGHGVGLDIHEPPSLYWKNEAILETNMILTIEPGIYLNDRFGYRWENTVLLSENGYEIMTQV